MPPGLGGALEFDLIFKAVDSVSDVVGGIAGAIGGLLQATVQAAAGYQTSLQQLQANTTLTNAQIATIGTTIQAMQRQSGAPLDQLSAAFMHATDLGFSLADATKIVQAGMESAVSTGSNVSDVVNVLALQMHDFGISATEAGHAMNVLHLAAAESNTTLESFVDSTSRAVTTAANLGIPITQVDAALAALSRHMDISQASTALAGEFTKLLAPSQAVQKELALVQQQTGIDLPFDFSAAGLQAKGLTGILADLHTALGGQNADVEKLIPATRGGLAAMVLLGTASNDYNTILGQLNGTMAGQTNPTQNAYNNALDTFNTKMNIVTGDLQQLEIAVGTPMLSIFGNELGQVISYVDTHQVDIENFARAFGTDVADAISGLITLIPKLFTTTETEWSKFMAFTGAVGAAFDGIGTGINNVLETILEGIYTMADGTVIAFENAINAVITGINGLFANLGMTDRLTPLAVPTMAQQQQSEAAWVQQVLGVTVNPATGHGYTGGGQTASGASVSSAEYGPNGQIIAYGGGAPAARGTTSDYGLYVASGGTLRYVPATSTASAGSGGGAAGNNAPWNVNDTGATGPGLPDLTALNKTLTDAKDQFTLDRINGASQTVLLQDIKTIMADMKAVGDSGVAIRLEQAQDLQAINKATTTTATKAAVDSNALAGYRLQQQAGYGQTIVSFGVAQQANAQAVIAQLQAQLTAAQQRAATDDRQVALVQEEVAVLKQMLGHTGATAQSTRAVADEARKPASSMTSALRSRGTALAVR